MEQFVEFVGNHYLLSIAWMAIFFTLVFTWILSKMSPVKTLSTQEVTSLINRQDAKLVDIRSEKEFNQGRILGSQLLAPEKVNKNDFATLEKYKDKPIIVVCAAGLSAGRVARQMVKQGFSNVAILKGGIGEWVNQKLPLAKK